ncbi:MAG: monovalent cation/H(+) antiporter subunit G [Gammaproteobacteria bacterium]|nr:monovalent cation/H(+) antiporter subunit G [Gammaproteobacteria bacterium]
MILTEVMASLLLISGCFFYIAGTVGLLRFPDVFSRLHALTKADNLGLFLICTGLAVNSGSPRITGLLLVVWILGLLAATVSCHLIARRAIRSGQAEPPVAEPRAADPTP